jgi:hypothetical protein
MEVMMVALLLIGKPEDLHIPYFAMPLPASKESAWYYPQKKCAPLSTLLTGNAYRWIVENQKKHDIRRIGTRNYIPRQTAYYANWLLFLNKNLAEDFSKKFPQYDVTTRIQKVEEQLAELELHLEKKLNRGAYDLSRYPSDQRRAAAQRYLENDKKKEELKLERDHLTLAKKLKKDWVGVISNEI